MTWAKKENFVGEADKTVPEAKNLAFSARENSGYKWKKAGKKTFRLLGALEWESEPGLNIHSEYIEHVMEGKEKYFGKAIKVWEDMKLNDELVKAVEDGPVSMACFGLIKDEDETIKGLIKALNKGWIKDVNERLKKQKKELKLEAFLWSWRNPTGKSETTIFMIRFFRRRDADDEK